MNPSFHDDVSTPTRPCAFCGKPVAMRSNQCPFCREMQPEVKFWRHERPDARHKVRQGLLFMLLAGAMYYICGGYSPFTLPFEVPSFVTVYLIPLLFLAGFGLTIYGLFLRKT